MSTPEDGYIEGTVDGTAGGPANHRYDSNLESSSVFLGGVRKPCRFASH